MSWAIYPNIRTTKESQYLFEGYTSFHAVNPCPESKIAMHTEQLSSLLSKPFVIILGQITQNILLDT